MINYRKLLSFPQKWLARLINNPMTWLGAAASLPFMGALTAMAITQEQALPKAPLPLAQQVTERLALPALPAAQASGVRYWREEAVQRGDTIARLLNRLGVDDDEATRFIHASPLSRNLLKLRTGATLSVEVNDQGELFGLRFLNDDENGEKLLVVIEKNGTQWQASADAPATETMQTVRSVLVKTSATGALAQAGIPVEVRTGLSEIFADQVVLSALRPGDKINVVYETLLYKGSPLATGNILGAEILRGKKTYQAFYFEHDSESGAYYDAAGKPLKKGFTMQPVNAQISSGFGMRFHPILRSLRMHEGVDYAAASGTPIVAPSNATVETVAQQNGYGNVVILKHNSKLSTLYAHMSQFAKGARAGKSVKAGDVIGYVGSTGRSTGPHLHFEVRINGQAVDPATNALPTPGLSSTQLAEFKSGNRQLTAHLQLLRELPTTIALLD
jgi:murein DD-endopeptidase MepM/ murein hydrolase activator NlpD